MTDTKNPGVEQKGEEGGERLLTVLLALGANFGVGVLKLVAGLVSGSARCCPRPRTRWGTARPRSCCSSRCAARTSRPTASTRSATARTGTSGRCSPPARSSSPAPRSRSTRGCTPSSAQEEEAGELWINYPVLALAFVLEGTSFLQAWRQVRAHAFRQRRSLRTAFLDPDDPTVNSVAMEDTAALVGLLVAGAGVGLHQLTGNAVYDGIASIVIGVAAAPRRVRTRAHVRAAADRQAGQPAAAARDRAANSRTRTRSSTSSTC